MAKPSRKIKLSKNLKPYVGRVVRDGWAQKEFTRLIGHPTGQCVAAKIPKGTVGYKGTEIHKIAASCAPAAGTVHYARGPTGARPSRPMRGGE